ncbi:MAG: hypothetical protein J7M01_01570 [Candidatus Marinimicrobia bacterium]|nr:hypothetical protein [Candidatus Neomarinimicrobiota bacterium]
MKDYIGGKARILLENGGKDFKVWNMNHPEISTEILGIEYEGVWVANNTLEVTFKVDKQGKTLSEQEQKTERVNAMALIPWRFIKGILVLNDERSQVIKPRKIGLLQ